MLHIKQYRRRLFSGSPKWKPQKTGTWPGSVVIDCMKDHMSMKNITLKTLNMTIMRKSSIQKLVSNGQISELTFGFRKPYYKHKSVVDEANHESNEDNKDVANYDCRSYRKASWHVSILMIDCFKYFMNIL